MVCGVRGGFLRRSRPPIKVRRAIASVTIEPLYGDSGSAFHLITEVSEPAGGSALRFGVDQHGVSNPKSPLDLRISHPATGGMVAPFSVRAELHCLFTLRWP
jgi:hypothetical protein